MKDIVCRLICFVTVLLFFGCSSVSPDPNLKTPLYDQAEFLNPLSTK